MSLGRLRSTRLGIASLLVSMALSSAAGTALADETPAPPVDSVDNAAPVDLPPAPASPDEVVPIAPPLVYEPVVPPMLTAPPPPPPKPFRNMFFENDFSYKRQPDHPYVTGEELKLIPLCEHPRWGATELSAGGEIRFRYLDEIFRLLPGPPGQQSVDQWRWRQYVDIRHENLIRAYVELLDASTNNADRALTPIDKNRWDLQNYLLDINLADFEDGPLWFRVGRQELLYGNERLISPLDWANIRRNFEGLKLFTRQETWDLDGWLVNPVNSASLANVTLDDFDNSFDTRNQDYLFGGAYFTYRGWERQLLDLFLLYTNLNVPVPGLPYGDRYTLGTRWFADFPEDDGDAVWHAEVEGGIQFGNDRSSFYDPQSPRASVNAGYFTAGLGRTWNGLPFTPTAWLYYDWASGDKNPRDGQNNTFFQLFGLVHKYLGLIDNVARQNISDVNTQFSLQLSPKARMQVANHWFHLATGNDVLYVVSGRPVGTPNNGTNVGQEFDLVLQYNHNQNLSLEAGCFWFWYGSYIDRTTPRPDASQIYLMTTFRY